MPYSMVLLVIMSCSVGVIGFVQSFLLVSFIPFVTIS